MRSPDPFSDNNDSNGSFENCDTTQTASRRRSEAIVASEEESFDGFVGSDQVTVIENRNNDTILIEADVRVGDQRVNLDDTITRLLESSDEENDDNELEIDPENDALANLLKSFRDGEQREMEEDEEDCESNVSIDVFGNIMEGEHEERGEPNNEDLTEDNNTLLPVEVPDLKNIGRRTRKRRSESRELSTSGLQLPSSSTVASASDGPAVVIGSDTGEYWNQPKTINIHGKNFEINSFNDYMQMKITKLNHQVNSERSKPYEKVSEILKGYSVFVNGYTDPPALVIRDLMMAHGGEYHCYYQHGITTYTIASSIATAKINRIREKEVFIKADWITESIAAGKPLDYRDFLIYEKGSQEKGQMQQFLTSSNQGSSAPNTSSSDNPNRFLDARNPNFIRDYYARSRLHLISTLAQDMKDFVANLKMEGKLTEKCFPEEDLIQMGQKQKTEESCGSIVFHVDLDCFFVSVAVRDRENLKNKAVAITHSKGTISNSMSEVASCSYAARSCGVKNGMLVRDALQKCPQLTLLPYQFDDYVQVSRQIYQILASYTLDLRAVSCDEMYINMSSLSEKYRIEDPTLLAEHIRKMIKEKTRCPASVGIGSTSLLARLATRHAKPDGVFWVTEEKRNEFISEEKIRDLPGFGYEMMNRLTSFFGEISKCGHLQQKSERELIPVFGPKLATKIFKQCRGIEEDADDFWRTHVRKSVSCDINYGIRFTKKDEVLQLMTAIGVELERKLTDSKMNAGSITLKLMVRSVNAPLQTAKFMGHGICDTFTKTCNIPITNRADVLTSESMKLYTKVSPKVEDLRGVGVTCGKLKIKLTKDAATAVLEMFGKKSGEDSELRITKASQSDIRVENNEVESEMQEKVIETDVRPIRKVKRIPHPSELRVANDVNVPGILLIADDVVQNPDEIEEEDVGDSSEKYLTDLENILVNEPTESSVWEISEILSTLLNSGKLLTFQNLLLKFESASLDAQNYHVEWYTVFQTILPYIKEEARSMLGFPVDSAQNQPMKRPKKTILASDEKQKQRIPREINVIDSTNDSLVK
ncbi:unnamed protein product [Caenorhabditis brenneri]